MPGLQAEQAAETDRFSLSAMFTLAALCLLLGIFPGLAIDWLSPAATLYAAALAVSVGAGLSLRSPLLLAIGALAAAAVALPAAPELSLVLLASEGTLKSLYPFTHIPGDLLIWSLALTLWSCWVVIRRSGLPRVPWATALFLVLSTLIVVAAMFL